MKSSLLQACFLLLLPTFFIGARLPDAADEGILSVVVNNIQTPKGSIRVAIYNSAATFLDAKRYAFIGHIEVGNNKSIRLDFKMPYGTYAATCYHDINDDHNLDKSTLGFPEEPYALSNNPSVKWRRPSFDETKFAFRQPAQTISLTLRKWKDR